MSWRYEAMCKGMDVNIFFPVRGEAHQVTPFIKELCAGCRVRQQCLDDALAQGDIQVGFYGGLSGNQRDAIISARYNKRAV